MSPAGKRTDRPSRPAAKIAAPTGAESPWVLLRSATRHPFIFERMVRAADPQARPGDVVNLYDKSGALFGRGFYNPRSRIVVRVLTLDDQPIDETFWTGAIARAIDLRRRLQLDRLTDAYRLIHAEGDGLSGLIAERYADCVVLELFSLGIFQRRAQLISLIRSALGAPWSLDRPDRASAEWRVVVRADPAIERLEGFQTPPEERVLDKPVVIREHGVRYHVDVAAGQKTGFFCDQRDNRLRFAQLARQSDVLDICCYTAGFGLCAKLLGDAKEVTSVDLDEEALAVARQNVNLNNTRINLVHADAFSYLRQMIGNARRFDAVALDPPKLAASRTQLDEALRKYHDLNSLAVQVVNPGGIFLTCSCSGLVSDQQFSQTVQHAARRAGRSLQRFDQSGAAPDHPVMPNCPESAYLKALWFRVL